MERKLPFQWQHNEFREAFGAFLDKEAVPYYDEWCNNHCVPHSYFEKMGQAGFMAMWVDKKYGGAGCTGDFLYTVLQARPQLHLLPPLRRRGRPLHSRERHRGAAPEVAA